jgi:hypothetical protein
LIANRNRSGIVLRAAQCAAQGKNPERLTRVELSGDRVQKRGSCMSSRHVESFLPALGISGPDQKKKRPVPKRHPGREAF